MKEYLLGEWRYSSTHSLTSALDGREWSDSRPCRFTPRERAPGTHWIGGWVDPRAVLNPVVKRKIPRPRQESKPRTPIVQPVAQSYTNWAITVLLYIPILLQNSQLLQTVESCCPTYNTAIAMNIMNNIDPYTKTVYLHYVTEHNRLTNCTLFMQSVHLHICQSKV
jgi:hypothetical protein